MKFRFLLASLFLFVNAVYSLPFPDVKITSPAVPNTTFNALTPFLFSADASYTNGSIQKVEFFVNDEKVGESFSPPYQVIASLPHSGLFFLTANAINNEGYELNSAIYVKAVSNTNGFLKIIPKSLEVQVVSGKTVTSSLSVTNLTSQELSLDMDQDGALSSGLWHQTTHRTHSGNPCWYYGIEGQWNYNTGGMNHGYLSTPLVHLPEGSSVLSFWEWRQVEPSPPNVLTDSSVLFVSDDGGVNWTSIYISTNNNSAWSYITVDLSKYAKKDVLLSFDFFTNDDQQNNFEGYYLDEVAINGAPMPLRWFYSENGNFKLPPHASKQIPFTFNSAGLEVGVYETFLDFMQGYTLSPFLASVPVRLTVLDELEKPTMLSATAKSPDYVQLTWKDNSQHESGFKIERRRGSKNSRWHEIAFVPANTTLYRDGDVKADHDYFYRVCAVQGNRSSDFSNEAYVKLPKLKKFYDNVSLR